MSASDPASVALSQGVDAALARVPAVSGVGQILAEGERNLVIGRAANLRRWAAGHLGRARPPKAVPGRLPPRPPTDLTPIAAAVAWIPTTSPFAQRLAYERVMARYVPLAKRRDLKRPAWLRVDPGHPLPGITVQTTTDGAFAFGPFRDTRAAARARDALLKHLRIRPCDFDFKPPVDVPDGLMDEMVRALESGAGIAGVPAWIGRAGGRSIVVECTRDGIEIYPVAGGRVLDEAVTTVPLEALEEAFVRLDWSAAGDRDDTPWLNAWRHGKHTGIEIPVIEGEPPASTAARLRSAPGGEALSSSK